MKTYLMSLKRVEHGKVPIKADSFEEALSKLTDEDFDGFDITYEFGYDDEQWAYDPEWGSDIIEEEDDILRAMQAGGIEIEVED